MKELMVEDWCVLPTGTKNTPDDVVSENDFCRMGPRPATGVLMVRDAVLWLWRL